jgi:pimeloyl-ACP methyl ester carboxylesterase
MWQQLPLRGSLVGRRGWWHRRSLRRLVRVLVLAAGSAGAVSGLAAPVGARSLAAAAPLRTAPAPAAVAFRSALGGWSFRSASRAGATGCGHAGLVCSKVVVPLDRAGVVSGSVTLHVEMLPAVGVQRGVLFLLAGGPGQASAQVFGLGSPSTAAYYRFLFPGYALVAFDGRGTGRSGPIDCPAIRAAAADSSEATVGADCATSLGLQRDFYGTGDQAEDIEAVRQSIGADRVALWGTSYGTKLALAYALAHPDRVERLLLDSVVPPELPEAFGGNVLRMLPRALSDYCHTPVCQATTAGFADDVVSLANSLDGAPLKGSVRQANGSAQAEQLNGLGFLSLVIAADLDPALAAELPAAAHAARQGDPQPLLRIAGIAFQGSTSDGVNSALYAATVCRDGLFPWQPETPIQDRQQLLDQARNGLPAGTLGPFGSWSAGLGTAGLCLQWPSPSGGTPVAAGPLPDVPVLALSGGSDMRTPTSDASSVVARFPQGRLLVVPGVGHAVLEASSSCAQQAVRDWILGRNTPTRCRRPNPLLAPLANYPSADPPGQPLNPQQTLSIAGDTIREAEATWLLAFGSGPTTQPVAGTYAGTLRAAAKQTITLQRYSITPGVELSGKLRLSDYSQPLTFTGTVTISGKAAAPGSLFSFGPHLVGRLGGKPVQR